MTDAPKTIWARQTSGWGGLERGVYQNSEIDGIPYTLTSSVQAQLKAADELARCFEGPEGFVGYDEDAARSALTEYRKAREASK